MHLTVSCLQKHWPALLSASIENETLGQKLLRFYPDLPYTFWNKITTDQAIDEYDEALVRYT